MIHTLSINDCHICHSTPEGLPLAFVPDDQMTTFCEVCATEPAAGQLRLAFHPESSFAIDACSTCGIHSASC